jgi:hypothetical protein
MAYTGGPLNELNGKMGISAPYKSVPVMKLIREHKPKSKEELVELIKWHSENTCSCGVKSQGTVEFFGKNLYESQLEYWGKYRYTLQECIQWEYDLFVIQSLKGNLIEKKAILELSKNLPDYIFKEAEGFVDEELRIDIVITKSGVEVGGIQVKPETFKMMRREVITFNKEANKKWGNPVFYLFYDDSENFINKEDLIAEIKKL